MIHIDIEIKNRNIVKDFLHKQYNKLEDLLFSIIQVLPERFIPSIFMEWLNRYIDKRINHLKQEQIKSAWRKMYLEKAIEQIHNKDKAPTEE